MGEKVEIGYIMILNHYELLGIRYDASRKDIEKAYKEKILKSDETIKEQLNTAYMVLTDDKRRNKYDLSIGIHKYKKVSPVKKVGKGGLRLMLTLLDAFFTWYWCFLGVLIIASGGYLYYRYRLDGYLDISIYLDKHYVIIIILGAVALVDLVTHYYIRRLNRKLKHYNWEVLPQKRGD